MQEFRKRWSIETGFRDHELFTPPSHARDDVTKTFFYVLDLVTFNSWKIRCILFVKAMRIVFLPERLKTRRIEFHDSHVVQV
nr:hypothetical protein [Candidatus Sigynarchaeota archaeon]